MLRYALRRLTYLPLSLFLLSLVCFGLQQITPGDPVDHLLPETSIRTAETDPEIYERTYRRAAASLGYDLPPFYFSIRNAALPDTLHRIVRPEERAGLRALTLRYGNWPLVQEYYRTLRRSSWNPDLPGDLSASLRRLLFQDDPDRIQRQVDALEEKHGQLDLVAAHANMVKGATRAKLLLPTFQLHGTANRYHRWAGRILSGDFGLSYLSRRPVSGQIKRAFRRTALLNGITLLVVYLIALPLGLYAAGYRGSRFDRWSTVGLFILFGLPSFWIATLLANFFTTPAYGMDWFPSMGFGDAPEGSGLWTVITTKAKYLFLPVLCLAYPSWAYVSRHLRRSALGEMKKAYVTTARLKGLPTSRILWGHVFRNASFPIITLLGGIFPALLAGSVLIEKIFNIPGMGLLLFDSAINRDWPVVIALVLLNGILTAFGLLVADLGYALADPRVQLGEGGVPKSGGE
ncbi:ABC transporter permease [Lewinella sp. W8]|uniref:ABC transporter permease n=1 Tax=Lewinella sp. W8 TaxID=2528208 RepID=UPI00106851FE|nr:ABC transporter permease [Lewinella sp. W8]MTB52895.1 ABC transporter permease subunit [Lewinella sp. W8]